ncbi:PREDICTED: dehydrogenase/reductase SDR family member 11-like [Amphimedon queenslandica]|uniref:Dehydrogenase/reductase SDR family member 11 n=3 Tax=Amphimedon queenslandica TaxID=400682 RepID=A0A1X7U1Q2_AMPQE|nr:PREDICTED: dehydrogenase/reductase SDR family member 11-like [Amphimedon queenslandica]|eukprot:XP_003389223.1 PREDICTED: dehydrogenase/reductase SDR family member 11-like [Amphimedon queenslandica]
MERWSGRVALVTGASAGIGEEIARQLVTSGMIVYGAARNVQKIQALSDQLSGSPGKLIAIKCDVKNEEEVKRVFKQIKEETNGGGADVCINNAGVSHDGTLLTGSTDDWRDMLDVNVLAPSVITREFMNDIKSRKIDDGHIVFINSMSGHRVTNYSHFYCATKYAVTALVEGIRQELREMKTNTRITAISPGLVRTEFRGRASKAADIEQSKKDYDSLVYNGQPLEAVDMASAVLFALSAPPRMEVNDIYIRPTAQVH